MHSKSKHIKLLFIDQQQDVLQAKGLDKEKQAASTGPSDPKKMRLCKNCGQPMKGHPKGHCPQELLDKYS